MMRRRGRVRLVFSDAHSDFVRSETASSWDLARRTHAGDGQGDALASIDGRAPLVRDDNVVVVEP
jgi:hypothetical protein